MRQSSGRHVLRAATWARLLLVGVASVAGAAAVRGEDGPPLELRPYRVQIDVAFGLEPDFGSEFREQVLRELREGLDRSAGALCEAVVAEDRRARPAGREPLLRLRAERIPTDYPMEDVDKLYLLSVESIGGGYRVAGLEWDTMTLQLGSPTERTFPERGRSAAELLEVLQALFRPQGAVSQVKGGPVILRARAGALAPHDDGWRPLRADALFEAYWRYLTPDQAVERVQRIPWTYLSTGDPALGASVCRLTSALRVGFSARRRRIEPVALGINRPLASTRLTMVTPFPTRRPQGGVEVEIFAEAVAADRSAAGQAEAKVVPRRLVTDRNGQVSVAGTQPALEQPLWLLVRSGQNLLARVPFVPGVRADEVLELPDDALRLEIEGRVAQIQSELVDAVARRAVLAALVRNRAKTREWSAVDDLLKQMAAMPKASNFSADLNSVRINAGKEARARKERITEDRIRKLCDETAELITYYLDDAKEKELREEIAELRQIAEDEAKAAREDADADKAAKKAIKRPAPPASAPARPKATPQAL